ncbi:hypothetical protein KO481_27265 [Nocardia sp. NEAU-G5]|uniref:Outer membrane channel protein CpnT-like N-terminal domain-containing protein n=1 Tax=Nocardia albiluteola TaxID=2842303 RepID=A0ABS6B4N4_9NOCA|nr:hypothetical protein [Nocardia albiluteola]MBU3065214.1 hypothetical protein [Nocardia albiluteola]
MSLHWPPALRWLTYVVGSEWPDGDEDRMFAMAQYWLDVATDLEQNVIPILKQAKAVAVRGYVAGDGADAVGTALEQLISGPHSVEQLAQDYRQIGTSTRQAATTMEQTKLMIIWAISMLATQIIGAWLWPPTALIVEAAAIGAAREYLYQVANRALDALAELPGVGEYLVKGIRFIPELGDQPGKLAAWIAKPITEFVGKAAPAITEAMEGMGVGEARALAIGKMPEQVVKFLVEKGISTSLWSGGGDILIQGIQLAKHHRDKFDGEELAISMVASSGGWYVGSLLATGIEKYGGQWLMSLGKDPTRGLWGAGLGMAAGSVPTAIGALVGSGIAYGFTGGTFDWHAAGLAMGGAGASNAIMGSQRGYIGKLGADPGSAAEFDWQAEEVKQLLQPEHQEQALPAGGEERARLAGGAEPEPNAGAEQVGGHEVPGPQQEVAQPQPTEGRNEQIPNGDGGQRPQPAGADRPLGSYEELREEIQQRHVEEFAQTPRAQRAAVAARQRTEIQTLTRTHLREKQAELDLVKAQTLQARTPEQPGRALPRAPQEQLPPEPDPVRQAQDRLNDARADAATVRTNLQRRWAQQDSVQASRRPDAVDPVEAPENLEHPEPHAPGDGEPPAVEPPEGGHAVAGGEQPAPEGGHAVAGDERPHEQPLPELSADPAQPGPEPGGDESAAGHSVTEAQAMANVRDKLAELDKRVSKLLDADDLTEQRYDERRNELDRLNNERRTKDAELTRAEADRTRAETDHDAARNHLEQLRRRSVPQHEDGLARQLREAQEQTEAAEEEATLRARDVERAATRLALTDRKLSIARSRLDSAVREQSRARAAVRQAQQELDEGLEGAERYRARLEELVAGHEAAARQEPGVARHLEREQEIARLREQLEAADRTHDEQVQDLERRNAEAQQRIQRLPNDREQLAQLRGQHEDAVTELRQRHQALADQREAEDPEQLRVLQRAHEEMLEVMTQASEPMAELDRLLGTEPQRQAGLVQQRQQQITQLRQQHDETVTELRRRLTAAEQELGEPPRAAEHRPAGRPGDGGPEESTGRHDELAAEREARQREIDRVRRRLDELNEYHTRVQQHRNHIDEMDTAREELLLQSGSTEARLRAELASLVAGTTFERALLDGGYMSGKPKPKKRSLDHTMPDPFVAVQVPPVSTWGHVRRHRLHHHNPGRVNTGTGGNSER